MRLAGSDDVREDAVDDFLIEGGLIPERGEEKLQGFRLDAGGIRRVADLDSRCVWLASHGA